MYGSHPDSGSIDRYLRDIGRHRLLTAAEEIELGRRVQLGDGWARGRMIESNLRLVVKIAWGYVGMGLPLEDLVAEGNVGLIRAVERFDPERGVRFGSYAALWIKQAIRRTLSERSRVIRLPSHILEKSFAMNAAMARLRDLLGREPSDAEIGAELGWPATRINAVRQALLPLRSLDEKVEANGGEFDLMSTLVDDATPSPSHGAIDADLRVCLERLLPKLNKRERDILVRRFGLDGQDPQTLDQIGDRIHLTRERVRQLQNEAIETLRKGFATLDRQPQVERRRTPNGSNALNRLRVVA
jgi:RNA polymerase sigma factor (sigma-70 family)